MGTKEVAENGGAFVRTNASENFELMIEAGVAAKIEDGTERARFRIASAIEDTGDASMNQRPHAHQAGFERNV